MPWRIPRFDPFPGPGPPGRASGGPREGPGTSPKIARAPRIPWRIPIYTPAYTQKFSYPVSGLRAAFLQHAAARGASPATPIHT